MKILFRQKDGYTLILSGWVAVLIILHSCAIIGLLVKAIMSPAQEWWWIPIVLLSILSLPLWVNVIQDEWHETR